MPRTSVGFEESLRQFILETISEHFSTSTFNANRRNTGRTTGRGKGRVINPTTDRRTKIGQTNQTTRRRRKGTSRGQVVNPETDRRLKENRGLAGNA